MEYLKTPYIPNKKISYVVIDRRTDNKIINYLKSKNINIIFSPIVKELYNAVSGHSDLFIHHIKDNILVSSPNTYEYFNNILNHLGFKIIKGNTILSRTYPENIAYNVARVGNLAFHNTKYTDKVLLEQFEKNNVKLIHVNQGYTKCSTCILSENAIITEDKNIAKVASNNCVDALVIKPGYIYLHELNYGFIGGSSGLLSEKELFFLGDISIHPCYNDIKKFCYEYNKKVVFSKKSKLQDIGSLIPISY